LNFWIKKNGCFSSKTAILGGWGSWIRIAEKKERRRKPQKLKKHNQTTVQGRGRKQAD